MDGKRRIDMEIVLDAVILIGSAIVIVKAIWLSRCFKPYLVVSALALIVFLAEIGFIITRYQ